MMANVASCINAPPADTRWLAADGDATGVNVIVEGGTSAVAVCGELAAAVETGGVATADTGVAFDEAAALGLAVG